MNPTTVQAAQAMETITKIEGSLTRMVDQLTTHVVDGRLDPDDQHAVRIIQSKIRFLYRLWNSMYAADPYVMKMARIELSLTKRDNGTLVQLGEKWHSQGRMDCRACDVDEKVEGSGLLAPACSLCPVCQKGVQHVYTVQGGTPGIGEVTVTAPEGRQGSQLQSLGRGSGNVFQMKECDNCGCIESNVVGTIVGPKKESWKTFKLPGV